MERSSQNHLVKILMIGDSGVGKTCLLLRFSDDNFNSAYLSTIGIDFKLKSIQIEGQVVKLQIWDTAGQERFRTLTETYYKGAMGIILVYDCTDENSFRNISNWVQQIQIHASPDVAKVLVANKSDSPNLQVPHSEGAKLAKQLKVPFISTSASTGQNVYQAFYQISREIHLKKKGPIETNQGQKLTTCEKSQESCCLK